MTADIELLRAERDSFQRVGIAAQARAERLEEALRLIAAPIRPDGTWNRDREACRQIACDALRDHDQENSRE